MQSYKKENQFQESFGRKFADQTARAQNIITGLSVNYKSMRWKTRSFQQLFGLCLSGSIFPKGKEARYDDLDTLMELKMTVKDICGVVFFFI